MPEGHTLRRLADDLTAAFAGRAVRACSPAGPLRRRRRAARRLRAGRGRLRRQAPLRRASAGERFVHVHLGLIGQFDVHAGVEAVPAPVGAVRLRLVSADAATRAGRRTPTCAAPSCATSSARPGATEILARLGPDPLRRRRRPRPGLAADLAQPPPDRRPADGPEGAGRRRQRLPRRGALPAPHPPAAPRQHPAGRPVARDLGRPGRADGRGRAVRSDRHRPARAHPRGDGPPARARDDHGGEVYVYRRTSMPCLLCGSTIRTGELVGRNIFWCPQCQPTFRSRAVQSAGQRRLATSRGARP